MILSAIRALTEGHHLSEAVAAEAMEAIMSGDSTPAQTAAFLMGLRMKGETSEEIAGLARVMRAHALKVTTRWPELLDTCGTGGAGFQTFNVSTTSAFVAAGAGAKVAKHGNRGMSNPCGSFDVLEALGIDIQLSPEAVGRCIDAVGVGFMFAQMFHPAMRHAAPVRREIGVRTVFNLLGPLTNPANACYQIIGAPRPDLTVTLAEALLALGAKRAMVVHGEPGLGEISTLGPTHVAEVNEGRVTKRMLTPEDLGLSRADEAAVRGGSPQENADVTRALLQGADGPKRELLLVNAGAALVVTGQADDFRDGMAQAARSIDSGAAWDRVEALKAFAPGAPPQPVA